MFGAQDTSAHALCWRIIHWFILVLFGIASAHATRARARPARDLGGRGARTIQ